MKIDPLEVQFHLVHDCIRAITYADYVARKKPDAEAWLSITDMFYSEAIISWNIVFGTDSQELHWKNISKKLPIPKSSKLKPFGKEIIIEYLGITTDEWKQYHKEMVDIRNERLAHFNYNISQDTLPNVTWALRSSYLYREWLLSLLREYRKMGKSINVTETSGEEMIKMFENQIAEICK